MDSHCPILGTSCQTKIRTDRMQLSTEPRYSMRKETQQVLGFVHRSRMVILKERTSKGQVCNIGCYMVSAYINLLV